MFLISLLFAIFALCFVAVKAIRDLCFVAEELVFGAAPFSPITRSRRRWDGLLVIALLLLAIGASVSAFYFLNFLCRAVMALA